MASDREKFRAQLAADRAQALEDYARRRLRGERATVPTRDGDLPVILYRAARPSAPVFFNMHGGGFIGNDAVLMDIFCDDMRRALDITVVNVNYRKAPDHPFPAALHDVYDVVSHVCGHADAYGIDPGRMGIGGHSAGANLAAAACILAARSGEFTFRCQMLDYPFLEMKALPPRQPDAADSDDLAFFRFMQEAYCRPDQMADPLISPVNAAPAELAQLPPAVFVLAGIDDLRDEGERYACMLIRAGVPVSVRRFAEALHGFIEVNNDDYPPDPRQSPAQAALAAEAIQYINAMLRYYLLSST